MDYSRDEEGLPRKERELTLGMGAILGIFFGLVLLCGLFFGLGYNVRGRQIASSVAAADAGTENSANPQFNNFKPAAGSPAGSKPTVVVVPDAAQAGQGSSTTNSASTSPANSHAATPANTGATTESTAPSAPIVRLAPSTAGHSGSPGNATATATVTTSAQLGGGPASAPPATGNFLVQVAAVSHQEDADLLMGALKGRGYAVSARTEPQDKLVHIQIGPFTNRRDAEAMRQRLQGDGYNAIIK